MVNYNDSSRTLSGVDERSVVSLALPSSVAAISIGGNVGEKGQVIAKNNITNKLEWDAVDDITIPDGSIEGKKLADNISFTTSGNITLSNQNNNATLLSQLLQYTIGLSGYGNVALRQLVNSATNWFEYIASTGKFIINNIIDLNGNLKVINGNEIDLFSDNGVTKQIGLNGTNGNITSTGITTLHNTTIQNALIVEGNGIFVTDIKGSATANQPYKYTLTGSTGNFTCNDIICNDITINNHTGFDEIRTNKIELPKTGNVSLLINNGGIAMTNANENIVMVGDITTSAGNLSVGGTSTLTGNISSTNGNLTLTNGNINCGGNYNSTNGNVDLVNGNLFLDNGVAFIGNIGGGNHRITLNGANGRIDCEELNNTGNYTSTAGNITLTLGNLSVGGNYSSTSGDITLTGGDLTVGGTTTTENITMNGNLTSTDGNMTLTNGNITLTNGTLFGNVSGTITEETIDAQIINLRKDPTGQTGGDTKIEFNVQNNETGFINMDYTAGAIGNSGLRINNNNANVFEVNKSGIINNVQTIIFRGQTFNNVNSGTFFMNSNNAKMVNTSTLSNTSADKLHIQFGGNQDDAEIRLRKNNTNRVVLDDDIRLFNSIQTETIHLISQNGDIQLDRNLNVGNDVIFDSQVGELIGKDNNDATKFINNYTECDNLYLGNQNNILYSTSSMAHWYPTSFCRKQIQNTPADFIDLNDKLQISYTSKARPVNLLITFHYYAHISAGCDLYLKLWDGVDITKISNPLQPTYLADTTQQVANGIGNDLEFSRTATFIVQFPANTTKNFRVAAKTVATAGHSAIFLAGPNIKLVNPSQLPTLMYGGQSLYLMATDTGNINTLTPTTWENPVGNNLLFNTGLTTYSDIGQEKLLSYSYIDNESQNFVRIYNTSNKFIFNGSQDSGTDTLEVDFTPTETSGYLEFGFYANSLTGGMIFMCGVAVGTGGTSPFSTTLSSSAVSIDAYKQGLFNGDTTKYSLKELLDFTGFENTYITSKFHFNNLTIGTRYKMALYGRCHNSGSIYINSGGKSTGSTSRSAHQPAFLKFYQYKDSMLGARTNADYVPPNNGGDDY